MIVKNLPGLALALTAVLVPLVYGGNGYIMGLMVSGLIVAGVALAWALLGNLGGMVSFGHAAYLGIGGYAVGVLAFYGTTSGWLQWGVAIGASEIGRAHV